MFSFAQNFEDVILARVFKNIKSGFYVDVGAHYPLIDSVTEYFYRLGWRGINIEPLPAAFNQLSKTRPLDLNLNFAVAERDGEMSFFALDGFSTLDPQVAAKHRDVGLVFEEITVGTRRLDTILNEHRAERIDFLKIDVEGAEGGVIRSNDWSRFRPSIVVIEAIDPRTHEPRFEDWEETILNAGYNLIYFDGVNRWYWNRDLPMPDSSCFLPPNALDHFTTFAQASAEARAAVAAREAAYEREHFHQKLIETASAIMALVGGDHATPTPHDELSNAWSLLRETLISHIKADKPLDTEKHLDLEGGTPRTKQETDIAEDKHSDENNSLLGTIKDLEDRLAFSEKMRLKLLAAAEKHHILLD